MLRARLPALLIVLLLAISLGRVAVVARDHLAAPFDLISEGPHMSIVRAIRSGEDIYDPRIFLDLPFHMAPYTPPYHLLVAALPMPAAQPFVAGRALTLACTLAAALALLAVGRTWGAVAIAVFFLVRPVTANAAYFRSDSLALAFAAWGMVVAVRAATPRQVHLAALLCALAFASKQSHVAAGLAAGLTLLGRDWRHGVRFGATVVAVLVALGLAAWATWGDGFWLAVTIPVTDYPRDWAAFAPSTCAGSSRSRSPSSS